MAGRTAGSAALPRECRGPAPQCPGAHAGAGHAPLAPPPAPRQAAITRAVIPAAAVRLAAGSRLTGIALLTRGAEQHPAQRHRPLLQHGHLLPLRFNRPGQRRVLRRQPRRLSLPELRAGTPQRHLIGGRPGASSRDHHAKAASPPQPVSSTTGAGVSRQRDGIAEYLRSDERAGFTKQAASLRKSLKQNPSVRPAFGHWPGHCMLRHVCAGTTRH